MKHIFFLIALCLYIAGCSLNIGTKTSAKITDLNASSSSKRTYDKIAIIIPQKVIKGYSNTVINSSFAYIFRQNAKLDIKVFLTQNEENSSLMKAIQEIDEQNFGFVIAATTLKGGNFIAKNMPSDIVVFIPTLHKNDTQITSSNIYFGRIDYDEQIKKLLEQSNSNIAIFSDNSALSSNLERRVKELSQEGSVRAYNTTGEKVNFARLIRSQGSLSNASVFLNTPIVTSSILASQLRANEMHPHAILLTQIGYNPTILKLTQANDRRKMIIANSISNKDKNLSYINEMFLQSIDYNWVAYATSVGLDYFYTKLLNPKASRIFKENIKNSQVIYNVNLMKALDFSFEEF
ncbi:hypothetical protein DMB92_01570 [Campylobacter sp. MIT 99-7217]|uniref:hypothetical protein n=1 Tax=Campylobacter sp. MIT 99-7217 TaxID=535091 RepID=UPI00115872DC|nr:hypothetical protein [Campylobacter sp. MIT 99-7217]TQR34675.1 hypothetical protein DMB92_01570 [Campylobacter sp. MIT 99-7217]